MSNWTKQKISDLGFLGRGKSKHRPRNDSFLYGGKYPFIQTSDVKHVNFYINSYSQTYNENGLKQSKLWQKDTLCITIAANIAETALLSFPACFPDSVVGFISDPAKSNVHFIKYSLDLAKKRFQDSAKGTAQDNLSLEKIESIKLDVPDIEIQNTMASILSAYDYLIENSEKRIKILEEMAQLLYTEWFVKFKFPGHERSRLIDSGTEYGQIPEGWEVKKLEDVVDFLEGPGLRNWQYRSEGIPFLNIRTIENGDIDLEKCNYLDEDEVNKKYPHFLLREHDIVVSSSGTLGRIAVIRKRHLPLCLNTSIIRFREVQSGLPKWFIKQYLLSASFQNKVKALASGAAQLNYGPSHLKTISIVVPDSKLLSLFNEMMENAELENCLLRDSINTLIKMRDLLIPQLVTGRRELK